MNTNHRHSTADITGTSRLEMFTDAVFAITITILVIVIGIPRASTIGKQGLYLVLFRQWPAFLSYIISFLYIGILWANHHDMFTFIRRSNHIYRMLNVVFLMFVAFVPFPTAILGEFIQSSANRGAATQFYAGSMMLVATMYQIVWGYAASNRRLVDEHLEPEFLHAMTRRYALGLLLHIGAFIMSFINAEVTIAMFVLLDIIFSLPRRIR